MKKLLPFAHGVLLFASLLSPFWADWKIVLVGFILYEIQKLILNGCVLSFAQFGRENGKPKYHFTPYYLKKIFNLKASDRVITIYLDYLLAPLVPIVAIILQISFGFKPLITI